MPKRKRSHVREPVQVYLDSADQDLLGSLVDQTGLSKAELLRRGLRQLAAHHLSDRAPGWSLDVLTGLIPDAPADLSARHDHYLAESIEQGKGGGSSVR